MTKTLIVIIAAIFIVSGSFLAYLFLNRDYEIKKLPDYYRELGQKCKEKESFGCCITSVRNMATGGYKLKHESGCPDGTQTSLLECVDSYVWCEPVDILKNQNQELEKKEELQWDTYYSKELKLSFKFSMLSAGVNYEFNIYPKRDYDPSGTIFNWGLGYNSAGGVSRDFAKGREEDPTDVYKWEKENGKIYLLYPTGGGPTGIRRETTSLKTIIHSAGVEGIIYKSPFISLDGEVINPESKAATLNFPEGYHSDLASITFFFYDPVSLEDIEKVLKSVEFNK